jgi:hypothetical protein
MGSQSHWVEIDLLRGGVPLSVHEALPPCEYLVHVSHRATRPHGLPWPIRLSQRLPKVTIPLRAEDPETGLDLQAVLDAVYDRAGYDIDLDYRGEPVPPLGGEQAAWAHALLGAKGLRPA